MRQGLTIDVKLLDYATPRQREVLEAIIDHGGAAAAARALGVNSSTPWHYYKDVVKKAARQGYSPEHNMTHTVPDGYIAKGVSTYYNKEGKPAGQWVKSSIDQERQKVLLEASIEAMASDLPKVPAKAFNGVTRADLLNLYTLTDSHVGMLAWDQEGGDNWDLDIAEKQLIGCFKAMVDASPPAQTAIVNQLGDFLHFDGLIAETPTSKHALDAAGRFSKIVAVALRILRSIISFALERHDKVHVILAEGNHDMVSSIWLPQLFAMVYENEPRVTVDETKLPFYAYRHGETMLAFHHGHMTKKHNLPAIFADEYAQVWGLTKMRYAHCGHMHHLDIKEHRGMIVTQHTTLAARDAYASRMGLGSIRGATAITYHDVYGEVATNTIRPEMIA